MEICWQLIDGAIVECASRHILKQKLNADLLLIFSRRASASVLVISISGNILCSRRFCSHNGFDLVVFTIQHLLCDLPDDLDEGRVVFAQNLDTLGDSR